MTYDFYGNWSANSGHNSPLYLDPADPLQAGSVDFSIQDYYINTRGIPASKLLCGIPFYGREFAKASEPYQAYKGLVKEWRYDEIMDKSGFTVKWDPVAHASYLSESSSFITYSNEAAVTEVCQYAQNQNLQGVMIWELSQAVLEDGSQPLLTAIGDEMLGDDPIGVSLTTFSARREVDGVHLFWSYASHPHIVGFNVLRADDFFGTFQKINPELLHNPSGSDHSSMTYVDPDLSALRWYKLQVVDVDGAQKNFGPILAEEVSSTRQINFQQAFELYQNYPNPFNPETNIRFDVSQEGRVLLEIYDVQGQMVKQLVNGFCTAGQHQVEWDATDSFGNAVPAGLYFYRVSSEEFVKTKRMILMK
jgi:hypothetical protein